MFVSHRYDLNVPLIDLSKIITKIWILTINGTKKILIIQLIKWSTVLFNQENKSISIKK